MTGLIVKKRRQLTGCVAISRFNGDYSCTEIGEESACVLSGFVQAKLKYSEGLKRRRAVWAHGDYRRFLASLAYRL
jgi:hypothetical protein